jgi:eukaryotic-like serine/threonine-protein kinase
MAQNRICPSCGAELPSDAPTGLCVACLLAAGLPDGKTVKESGPGNTIALELPLTEKPGDRIARYKLLQQIGEGGCGVVYMAEQQEPVKRRVALKVIKLGMDTKEVVGRFEAERQALALMDHPNIAKVLDAGATENGRPYCVMELVKGIPITRYCDENKLDTKQRLDLFIQVCQAIQHAHQKGIIHRDIKPSNILVADHDGVGVPKIIDFGIAKATAGQTLTDKTVFTAFEQFIGTPAYMSPEQAKMSGLDIDTRSDIYSLGVLLYELLTGRTPFDAKRLMEAGFDEIRRIIREEDPPRPSTKLSTLDAAEQTAVADRRHSEPPKLIHLVRGDLDWIVMKTLEKDRNRRYKTANGLASDLQRHLNNEPVLARPPSQVYRFQKLVRRNKLAFTAIGCVVAALVAGISVSIWQAIRAIKAERQEKSLREKAQTNERKAAQKEREAVASEGRAKASEGAALWTAYVANLRAAESSQMLRELDEAKRRLEACPAQFRGWEWNHLMSSLDGSLDTYPVPPAPKEHPAALPGLECVSFSPDGRRIAAISEAAVVVWKVGEPASPQVLRLEGDGTKALHGNGFQRSWVQFSHTSDTLLANTEEYARLWNVVSGQLISDLGDKLGLFSHWSSNPNGASPRMNGAECLAMSAEGTFLVSKSHGGLKLHEISLGKLLSRVEASGTQMYEDETYCLAISPDGKWIAAGMWTGPVRLFRAENLSLVRSWQASEARYWTGTRWFSSSPVSGIAFSPDSRRLVTGSWDGTVRTFECNTGQPARVMRGHEKEVNGVAYSPAGDLLASASADKTVRIWDAAEGFPVSTLVGHSDRVVSVAFSPSGRVVASADPKSVRLWSVDAGEPFTRLPWHDRFVAGLCSGPEGYVASADENCVIRIWDLRSGACVSTIPPTRLTSQGSYRAGLRLSHSARKVACLDFRRAVRIWDWDSHELVAALLLSTNAAPLNASSSAQKILLVSRDLGTVIAGINSGNLELWQPEGGTNTVLLNIDEHPITTAASDPAWRTALFGTQNGGVLVFDIGSKSLKARYETRGGEVQAVAVSNDGQVAATGGADGVIHLWSLSAGGQLGTLTGHDGGITSLAFSPDGSRLVSGSQDATARVWDVSHQELLVTLRHYERGVTSVVFSDDGSQIITGDDGGIARIWQTNLSKERASVCALVKDKRAAAEGLVAAKRRDYMSTAELLSSIRSDKALEPAVSEQAENLARTLTEDWWEKIIETKIPDAAAHRIERALGQQLSVLPSDFEGRLLAAAISYRNGEYRQVVGEAATAEKIRSLTSMPYIRDGWPGFEMSIPKLLAAMGELQPKSSPKE